MMKTLLLQTIIIYINISYEKNKSLNISTNSARYVNHTIETEKDIHIVTFDDDLRFDHLFTKRYKIENG